MLVQGGMSPFDVLRAATSEPARYFGIDSLGTIEVGNTFPRAGTDAEWKVAGRDAMVQLRDDTIRLTTPDGVNEYRVVSTKVVPPTDTSVLEEKTDEKLVLVTCYPFYFIGPAPKRFIVEAVKN